MSLWSPTDLTNLVGWWDADSITGLSDTDAVSTWSDNSSSGWNASSSGGNRPTYRTNILNGKPIVRFSGSNHLSLGSINLFRNVGGGTIYAITKDAAITTLSGVFQGSTPSSVARLALQSGGGGAGNNDKFRASGRRLDANSLQDAVSTQQVTTNWTMVGCVANWQGTDLSLFVDGVVDGQNASFQTSGNTSDTASSATATCIGSTNTSNANGFNGDIAEIVVTHNAISTSDRQKLEGYLAWKWRLEGNLPAGHPYKTGPFSKTKTSFRGGFRSLSGGFQN